MITKDKISEIFCICDDFLKEFYAETAKNAVDAPKYRGCGKRKCSMSDAEIITILISFHFNSYRNFKHYYLFYVREHLRREFPRTLSYNRFVEVLSRVAVPMLFFIRLMLMGECTGISFVDSTCIPVCHNKRIPRVRAHKVFKDRAAVGKSTMGWYFGFKLHLLCNEKGELLNFVLTKANVDDRDEMVFNEFSKNLFGKLYADKGYISQELFESLWNDGIHIVTGLRSNMKNRLMSAYDKIMLRKRSVIETVNDELKNVAMLVHSRHRSFDNFLMNVISAIAAYCLFDKKPAINMDLEVADSMLPTLF